MIAVSGGCATVVTSTTPTAITRRPGPPVLATVVRQPGS
jgi:hypothetical protein